MKFKYNYFDVATHIVEVSTTGWKKEVKKNPKNIRCCVCLEFSFFSQFYKNKNSKAHICTTCFTERKVE
jgi:hypothetical protein